MALTKPIPLPISGGLPPVESAYILPGDINIRRVKGEVECIMHVYRDKAAREACSKAHDDLEAALSRKEAALAEHLIARAMPVTDAASRDAQRNAFNATDDALKIAEDALAAAYAAVESDAIKPFITYSFVAPLADVSVDGKTPDIAKLYERAKAVREEFADAKDC